MNNKKTQQDKNDYEEMIERLNQIAKESNINMRFKYAQYLSPQEEERLR